MAQPTIGRDVELAQAERVVEDVLSEQKARALLFLGPPGIGKSRLLREIEQRLERAADPVCLLRARGEPLRRSTALSLFATAISGQLRTRLGIDSDAEGPPPDTMREALIDLAEQAIEDEDDAVACAEFLGELLGVPMPESTTLRAARADPPLMADRLQLAVQDYLGALCETRPVVLVLEDLQWADGSSLDVLEALLDQLADAPFFVCASARPEVDNVRRDLLSGRDAVRVEVRGLSRHDVSMLAQLLAGRRLDERLLDAVFERSGGNPLFVEQIVLALKDEERLDAPTEDLPLPITVEAAVQSRLDHLAPEEKELCKRAAVFGRPFTADEVERLGAIGAERSLGALRRRELVATRRRAGTRDRGPEYRFRSTLIADVAYRMIPDEQLQELHRAAATMLDARRDVERAEVAAHFEKAGEAKLAAERYAEAVLAAARRFDTATVIHCSERALELGAPEESRHGLHMARADALRFVGRHDEQSRELAAALAHAATDHQRARVLGEQAAWLTRRGKSDEAVSTGTAAVTMARSAGEDAEIARTLCIRAAAQLYAGRLDEARASLEDAARTATEGHPEVRALTADLRAQLASATGNLDERREAFRAAVDLYTDAGDVRRAANAELNLADADNRVGAYGEAAMALTACLEKCRRVGNRLSEGYALLNLGYATMMLGKVDEALSCLEQAAVLAESSRDARLSVFVDLYRARARLHRDGRLPPEDPESIALRAADIRMDAVSVLARTVAAEAALAAGDPARALASSSSAMQTLRQLGGIEEDEAEVYLTHAHALEASHRPEEARLIIEEGRARLRDVASRIQDVAFRDRFLRDVSAHRELMISP